MKPDKTISLYKGKVNIEFFDEGHKYFLVKPDGKRERIHGMTKYTGVIDKSGPLVYWAVNLSKNHLEMVLGSGRSITFDDINLASTLHRVHKQTAADVGTRTHKWIEDYVKAKLARKPEPEFPKNDPQVMNGIIAFLKWKNEYGVKFIFSEKLIYSKKYNFTGLADLGITLASEKHKIPHLTDIKTGNPNIIKRKIQGKYVEVGRTAKSDHRFQVAGYEMADEEESGVKYGDKIIIYFGKETGEFDYFRIDEKEKKADQRGAINCIELTRRLDVMNKENNNSVKS